MIAVEANLDGLVGPTHNYAGLSFGNVASEAHGGTSSNPRAAALQGLRKMKYVRDLGLPQLIMPPQPRIDRRTLACLGFTSLSEVPSEILAALYSASSMWTANAATVSPSADTADRKLHFTPANLLSKFHRAIEPPVSARYLKRIFSGPRFVHHAPLPAHAGFADEGAANHMRLASGHGLPGVELFVYGGKSRMFPARQARAASEAVIRLHGLSPDRAFVLEQRPAAIDAGVFHNDVIAMSTLDLLIHHEQAFGELPALPGFRVRRISEAELPLSIAVSTYFFNSQLLEVAGEMHVVAPAECEENAVARTCFRRLQDEGLIARVHVMDLRESMKNGGGPACLRLRVPLTEEEKKAVLPEAWLTDDRFDALCRWIERFYRDRIVPDDLRAPELARESEDALSALGGIIAMDMEPA